MSLAFETHLRAQRDGKRLHSTLPPGSQGSAKLTGGRVKPSAKTPSLNPNLKNHRTELNWSGLLGRGWVPHALGPCGSLP